MKGAIKSELTRDLEPMAAVVTLQMAVKKKKQKG